MRDNGTVLSDEQLLVAYQRAVDDATMEFVDDEMECHRRGVRAIERAVLEAVGGQKDERQRVCDYLLRIIPDIGTGEDPVGFLTASHEMLGIDNTDLRARIAELERERGDAQHTAETYKLVLDCALEEIPTAPDECRAYIELPGYIEQLRTERDAARRELAEALSVLAELTAQVRGECPSLLNEDSGGDARLDMRIRAALAHAREGE